MALYNYNGFILPELPKEVVENYPKMVIFEYGLVNKFLLVALKEDNDFNIEFQVNEFDDSNPESVVSFIPKNNDYIVYLNYESAMWENRGVIYNGAYHSMEELYNTFSYPVWSNYNIKINNEIAYKGS